VGLRITITPQDNGGVVIGSPVELCNSPDPIAVSGLRINGKPILQLADFMRADFGRVFDRKNRRVSVSFRAFRGKNSSGVEFSSFMETFVHGFDCAAFESVCPHFGLITLEAREGASTVLRYLDKSGLQEIGGIEEIIGCGLFQSYQIISGTPLTALPVST
jgi:hypothetical protein